MSVRQTPLPLGATLYAASVSNSDGTLTISPTTGAVVASLNLSNANTWLAEQTFDDGIIVHDSLSVQGTGADPTSAVIIKSDTQGSTDIFTVRGPSSANTTNFLTVNSSGEVQLGGTASGTGGSGVLKLYSEQGVTDFTTTVKPNPSSTANWTLTLPASSASAKSLF